MTRQSLRTDEKVHGVSAPALVVMGERDRDFPSPAEEAARIADRLRGRALMVSAAGRYPQSQRPDVVAQAVMDVLRTALWSRVSPKGSSVRRTVGEGTSGQIECVWVKGDKPPPSRFA